MKSPFKNSQDLSACVFALEITITNDFGNEEILTMTCLKKLNSMAALLVFVNSWKLQLIYPMKRVGQMLDHCMPKLQGSSANENYQNA